VIVVDPLPSALTRIADVHLKIAPGQDASVFNVFSRKLILDDKYDKDAETFDGFLELKQTFAAVDEAALLMPDGVAAEMDKAYGLIRDEVDTAVIFASGITNSGESLDALLNFCLLKGLHKRGLIMPAALQANAVGAVSILKDMASPDELLCDSEISGLFIYEDDPFHYLNATGVKKALAQKPFIAVCDLLPTAVMDFAHIVVPTVGFAEKEGAFISGDGSLRAVKRALGTATGYEFLNDLLGRLGGKRYNSPAEINNELRELGILNQEGDAEEAPVSGKTRFAASSPPPGTPVPGETGKYRLILRDIFMNHHLCDLEPYGKGIARVQKDQLFLSPEDAESLGIADGESLRIEGADGAMTRPVTIKAGMKAGVLECLLGDTLRQGVPIRGEVLALSSRPSKVIAVSVRKV